MNEYGPSRRAFPRPQQNTGEKCELEVARAGASNASYGEVAGVAVESESDAT